MPSVSLARDPKQVIVQWVGIGTNKQTTTLHKQNVRAAINTMSAEELAKAENFAR